MKPKIYFDNAATTFPKPACVCSAVCRGVSVLGGNPGRGGHSFSRISSEIIFNCREEAASLFGASPENVVFTANCTHALNAAIKGVCSRNDHIVISSMEHNSVARPCYRLAKEGARVEVAMVGRSDDETISNFTRLITDDTKCVICTAASNVTGRIMPLREIGEICKRKGVCFIVDAAQAAGSVPISLDHGINFICCAGHKGLYGPTGTGLLISDGKYLPDTVIEGGTGATSLELDQTPDMPERLESGTLNTVGICGLLAGIKFIKRIGISRIYDHERLLCNILLDGLKTVDGAKVYRRGESFVPIVSFNIEGFDPTALSTALDGEGFALRGGLQCAPLAHHTIKTLPAGTIRFSPSCHNTQKEVISLVNALKKFSKQGI